MFMTRYFKFAPLAALGVFVVLQTPSAVQAAPKVMLESPLMGSNYTLKTEGAFRVALTAAEGAAAAQKREAAAEAVKRRKAINELNAKKRAKKAAAAAKKRADRKAKADALSKKNADRAKAKAAGRAKVKGQKCKVCLYEHANYKGKSFCTSPAVVPSLKKHGLKNRASSVKFKGADCKKARLALFEDPKYKSYQVVITKDTPHLSRLKLKKGSKRTWNDVADSFKFTK